MKLLLCAATEFEIKPSIEYFIEKKIAVEIVITGIGLTAATYALTKAIATQKPQLLIQAGIAGSLNSTFSLGNVVAVKNEMIGDMGVTENGIFHSVFDMKLSDANLFPWKKGMLTNQSQLLYEVNLPCVNGITINEISTTPERILHYKNIWKADIESMEGAALHYTGLMENIPFLQIRSLSNFVGERDKTKWMLKEALTHLNVELQKIILKLLDI